MMATATTTFAIEITPPHRLIGGAEQYQQPQRSDGRDHCEEERVGWSVSWTTTAASSRTPHFRRRAAADNCSVRSLLRFSAASSSGGSKYASITLRAMGAAACTDPPFSTKATNAIVGFSSGASAMYQAWSRKRSAIYDALYSPPLQPEHLGRSGLAPLVYFAFRNAVRPGALLDDAGEAAHHSINVRVFQLRYCTPASVASVDSPVRASCTRLTRCI